MKRIILIVVVIAMILSLAACKGSEPEPSVEPTATSQPTAAVTSSPSPTATAAPSAEPSQPPEDDGPVIRISSHSDTIDLQDAAEISISRPVMECPSDPAFKETFDRFFDEVYSNLEDDFISQVDDYDGSFGRWHASISFEETYVRDEGVSVRITTTTFTGGAHESSSTAGYTLTRADGLVTIADLFGGDEEAVRASIVEYIQKQIDEEGSELLYDTAKQDAADFFDWSLCTLDAYGVMVVYDEYTLAPFTAGKQYFVVPFSEVAGTQPDWIY